MRILPVALLLLGASRLHADPARDIAKLVDAQFADWKRYSSGSPAGLPVVYAKDAPLAMTGAGTPVATLSSESGALLFGVASLDKWKLTNVHIGSAHDGKSAWASFDAAVVIGGPDGSTASVAERGSELFARVGDHWEILAAGWSIGSPDAAVNRDAKAGKLEKLEPVATEDRGDASLLDAFRAVLASGLDASAAKRAELFAIGSAPGELTTSGKVLAGGLKAGWVGHATLDGPILATLAPSGTTGSVLANVQLAKGTGKASYKIPFRLFVVFDKLDGAWSVVHMHFAVP